ncbi:uncharacterized protein LOC117666659 [Pantherophis guttatus]|uniref:Uncharacterized protein LOC117666659 n=1 Tax=Pantherophis guttatus TaxID=94885 RepID=A0A6P9BVC0_PANGU|nr:uncharacterized protein LOC117666659 [Pantherophis guttatus]
MAILLLLSVLVTCVSFHGTSANTGVIISGGALDNFYQSSREPLQSELEVYLKALAPFIVSGHFLEVTITAVVVTKIELSLVPGLGLNVLVCASIHLRCVTLASVSVTVIANVCVTLRLRVTSLELVVDDCSAVFGEMRLDLLSISIQVPRVALIGVLGGPICQAYTVVCRRLNFLLVVDLAPISLPAGCRYDRFPPRITASLLELPFVAVCAGVSKQQPPVLSCGHLYTGPLGNNFVYYTSAEDLTCLFTALLDAKVFDKEITPTTMTTTVIVENFPQVNCPRGLSVVVRIVCTSLKAEIRTSSIYIDFGFGVTIGYVSSGGGYVPVLHFVVTGRFGIRATINCARRLVSITMTTLSAFNIVGSCATGSCVIDSAVAERVFPLGTWCRQILSVNLKERIHLLLPTHFSCDTCSSAVYRQGCAYISCSPGFR